MANARGSADGVALPPEIERAIEGADTATLQALLPHAGTESLDDLRERLGA